MRIAWVTWERLGLSYNDILDMPYDEIAVVLEYMKPLVERENAKIAEARRGVNGR